MRILVVHKYARVTSGADVYCLAITRLLRDAGHEVRWLSTAHPDNVETDGIFVAPSYSRGVGRTVTPARVAVRSLWNADAGSAMHDLLREFRPDAVQCHKLYPQLSVAPVVVASRRGVPVVQRLHDYEFLSAGEVDPDGGTPSDRAVHERALMRTLLGVRRRVHAPRVSRFLAATRFVAEAHEPAGIRAAVIPHFIDECVGVQAPFSERRGAIFVGRLLERKGAGDLAACVRLLAGEVPVTVIGDGPLESDLRAAGADCLGRLSREEAIRRVGQARVSLVPSRSQEAAGHVAVEAMAVGTPVIAYANGGLAEYVGDAGGIVIPPDPLELAGAIRDVYGDERGWRSIADRQLDRVREYHSPERHLEKLVDVYSEAIADA